MTDINKKVGKKIRYFRKQRGWSQERLALETGLHRAYIGQIERGEKNLGIVNLEKISLSLGVKMKFLFDE
jgi:transcriptional regulator with XRE-family HTH domain